MEENEYLRFYLGSGVYVRIVITVPVEKMTQKQLDRLIRHLEITQECLGA